MRFSGGSPGRLPAKYTPREADALVVVIVFAIISILAVGAFLVFAARLSIHAMMAKRRRVQAKRSFFQTQLGAYTLSLLLANLWMSVAFILNAHWVAIGSVERNALCTAQGFIKQLSITASSYFTSAIAIHAFTTLACKYKLPDWLCGAAVVSGWAVSAVMGIIPAMIDDHDLGSLYGFDGLSCGISLEYPGFRLFFQVIPVFLALSASILFYGLVYAVIHGMISTSHGIRVNLCSEDRKRSLDMDGTDPRYQAFILTVAKSLLLYPIAFIVSNIADMVIDLSEVAGNRALPFGLHVFGDSTLAMLGLANAGILFNTLRIVAPVFHTGQCPANGNLRPPRLVTSDSESFFAPSSSPIDPPAKVPFSELKPATSIDSACNLAKAHTSADGYLAPMLPAHFSPGRRSHASVNLSDAMAALKLPGSPKRGSRAQSPDKSASRYSFPRIHARSSVHRSAPSPAKPPSHSGRTRTNGDAARHKPPPLEGPLRSPVILPTVTIVGPHVSDSTSGERSPEVRFVQSDVEHRVVTSPPHSAALLSVSRPASVVDATAPQPTTTHPTLVQPSPARSTFSTRSAPSTLPSRSTTSSMQPLLGVPGARTRAPNYPRASVASSVRASSIASSTTSYRGLPPNPKALRAAWEGATVKGSSPLSSSFSAADLRPPTAMGGRPSTDRAATPLSSSMAASESNVSLATASSAPLLGATPGKWLAPRPVLRARSNNDIRSARPNGARPMLPRAASTSAPPTAWLSASTIATRRTLQAPSAMSLADASVTSASRRPSAEDLSTRTPSVAALRSPSAVSLVGDGAVPLLAGRRRTVRSSKSVVISPGNYI